MKSQTKCRHLHGSVLWIFSIITAVTVICSACSSTGNTGSENSQSASQNAAATVKENGDGSSPAENREPGTYQEYDEFGNNTRTTKIGSDGKVLFDEITRYDSRGNRLSYEYNPGTSDYVCQEFEYDSDNRLIKKTDYRVTKEIGPVSIEKYEYNSEGKRNAIIYLNPDGTVDSSIHYEFTDRGDCLKETWKDADGNVTGSISYEYDSNGTRTGTSWYDENGELVKEEHLNLD